MLVCRKRDHRSPVGWLTKETQQSQCDVIPNPLCLKKDFPINAPTIRINSLLSTMLDRVRPILQPYFDKAGVIADQISGQSLELIVAS